MSTEPSDISKLLRRLGKQDATCEIGARMLEMSEYRVLDVCRAVIEQLAVEKAALQEMNIRLLMLSPPAPIIVKIGKSDLPGSQD